MRDDDDVLLYWSVKETIYKCVYPSLKRFVGFKEVKVEVDFEGGRWRGEGVGRKVEGVFWRLEWGGERYWVTEGECVE